MRRRVLGILIVILTLLVVWDIQSHSLVELDGYDIFRIMYYDVEEMARYGRSGFDFRLMMYNVFMMELTLLLMLGKWGELSGGFASFLSTRLKSSTKIPCIYQKDLLRQNVFCTIFEVVQAGILLLFFSKGEWGSCSMADILSILLFMAKRMACRQLISLWNALAFRGVRQEWLLIGHLFLLAIFMNIDIQWHVSLIAYKAYTYQLITIALYGIVYILGFGFIGKWLIRKELL